MPKLAHTIPQPAAKTRAVRRIQDRHDIRRAAPGCDPSDRLLNALEDVTAFGTLPAYRRRQIERTIDALIAYLDAMDADPDLEPEEDRCTAEDDFGGLPLRSDGHPGDADDREDDDPAEDSDSDDDRTNDFEHDDADDPGGKHWPADIFTAAFAMDTVTNLFDPARPMGVCHG